MREEIISFESIRYLVRYPKAYDPSARYPVILFLHGAGTRGDDITLLKSNPFFSVTEKLESFPFVAVAPQCNRNTWFDLFETLEHLAEKIRSESFTDSRRLYLMGVSMGGYGAWQLAMSIPEYFAAVCPICGGGMYWNAARLKNVPVWAFHGAKDQTVLAEESVKMAEAVRRAGGNAKLTLYPENGHDAWTDTFSNPEVFAWMLEQENAAAPLADDGYAQSSIYG